MTNLDEFLAGCNGEGPKHLEELKLGAEPVMVVPFTSDIQVVEIHYEADPSARGYVICPGERCPACHLRSRPTRTALLPLYSIEHQEVRVLRVPQKHGPRALGTQLLPLISKADAGAQMILLQRDNEKYTVELLPLAESAERGEAVIATFVESAQAGLDFAEAFTRMTAEEYAEVPRIKLKLEARGDYFKTK